MIGMPAHGLGMLGCEIHQLQNDVHIILGCISV